MKNQKVNENPINVSNEFHMTFPLAHFGKSILSAIQNAKCIMSKMQISIRQKAKVNPILKIVV